MPSSSDQKKAFAELLRRDPRYTVDAYNFVFEALKYGHDVLELGSESALEAAKGEPGSPPERHLTGQELCEAIRLFALEQYGLMAQKVLGSWGVRATSDFGNIVFNLISIDVMKKTPDDRREHFENVFDFDAGFRDAFKITMPGP